MYLEEIATAILILIIVILIRLLANAKRETRSLMLAKQTERREKQTQEQRESQQEELFLVLKTTKRDRTRLYLIGKDQDVLMYSPAGYTKPDKAIALANRVKNAKLVVTSR